MNPPLKLQQIQTDLLNGTYSCYDLVKSYLANAASYESHNMYVELFADEVLNQAKTIDKQINTSPNTLGPLFGAVVSIKDNLCYKDHISTAGSKMLDGFISPYSATVVDRLINAGAIIIGRTNCDEFSMGSTNETSFYGPVKNALDPKRVAGGSSGGAAVAVKLNTCLISIGSDTGGSVRQPAAFNGIYAFKPSYGLLSRWGLIAYGSSFDQIGILGQCVDDISKVLNIVSGPDDFDSTAIQSKSLDLSLDEISLSDKKVFYPSELISHSKLGDNVKQAFTHFRLQLEEKGVEVCEESFPYSDLLVPVYYILCCAEASSNLSRFDGVRYGHQASGQLDDYRKMIKLSRTEGFGKEVKKRIVLGNYVLSEGYFDAYFKKAQQIRTLIIEKINQLFEKYDFLILPTTTSEAWHLGESQLDPIETYLSDMYTVLANLCGIPSFNISITNKDSKKPLGMQVLSKSREDKAVLDFVAAIT